MNGWTESDGCGWEMFRKEERDQKKDEGEERRSRADSFFFLFLIANVSSSRGVKVALI